MFFGYLQSKWFGVLKILIFWIFELLSCICVSFSVSCIIVTFRRGLNGLNAVSRWTYTTFSLIAFDCFLVILNWSCEFCRKLVIILVVWQIMNNYRSQLFPMIWGKFSVLRFALIYMLIYFVCVYFKTDCFSEIRFQKIKWIFYFCPLLFLFFVDLINIIIKDRSHLLGSEVQVLFFCLGFILFCFGLIWCYLPFRFCVIWGYFDFTTKVFFFF